MFVWACGHLWLNTIITDNSKRCTLQRFFHQAISVSDKKHFDKKQTLNNFLEVVIKSNYCLIRWPRSGLLIEPIQNLNCCLISWNESNHKVFQLFRKIILLLPLGGEASATPTWVSPDSSNKVHLTNFHCFY